MKSVLSVAVLVVLTLSGSARADHAEQVLWDGAGVSSGTPPFEATFEAIQFNVFTPSCALSFCHGAAMAATLDLREGASYTSLVDVPSAEFPAWDRVDPFNPDESWLICKLEACPNIVGQQMPLINGPLDQEVIDVIRAWITEGALEEPIPVTPTSWGQVKASYR